jgi:choline dehydrogenase-like flavoprotein
MLDPLSLTDAQKSPPREIQADVAVIGSGAGGSVVALQLAKAGYKTVIIEEGPLPTSEILGFEPGEKLRSLYRFSGINPMFGSPMINYGEGRCVGGTTVVNAGYASRIPDNVIDEWRQHHGYEDGIVDRLQANLDHFWERLNGSTPTLDAENRDSHKLKQGCEKLGWKYGLSERFVEECQNLNNCTVGCPVNAKKSTLVSLLPEFLEHGGHILYNARCQKLVQSSGSDARISRILISGTGGKIEIMAKYFFVCCGPLQSPALLRRNGIKNNVGDSFQLHINLKFLATYADRINAEKGTVSQIHVREFEDQGVLISAANYYEEFVLASVGHLPHRELAEIAEKWDHHGLFVTQFRSKSRVRVRSMNGTPVMKRRSAELDVETIRESIVETSRVLFASGAEEIHLPIMGQSKVKNLDQAIETARQFDPNSVDAISVHGMSSCPMTKDPASHVVDFDGRIRGMENLYVADASVIPTNTGESPQATVMAFAKLIVDNFIDRTGN